MIADLELSLTNLAFRGLARPSGKQDKKKKWMQIYRAIMYKEYFFAVVLLMLKLFAQSDNLTRKVCALADRCTGIVCAIASGNSLRNLTIVQEWCAQSADRVQIFCAILR